MPQWSLHQDCLKRSMALHPYNHRMKRKRDKSVRQLIKRTDKLEEKSNVRVVGKTYIITTLSMRITGTLKELQDQTFKNFVQKLSTDNHSLWKVTTNE